MARPKTNARIPKLHISRRASVIQLGAFRKELFVQKIQSLCQVEKLRSHPWPWKAPAGSCSSCAVPVLGSLVRGLAHIKLAELAERVQRETWRKPDRDRERRQRRSGGSRRRKERGSREGGRERERERFGGERP